MTGSNNNFNQNNNETLLKYILREPQVQSDCPPVLFLLHGVGSNEEDLFSFADNLPGKFLVISVRAPYILGPDSYAWYQVDFSTGQPVYNRKQADKSRNDLLRFIVQMQYKYQFDDKQIYLCGFSQGAIMSYSIGLTHPDIIKGIAIMSGRLLDEIKSFVDSNEKLSKLSVFISHGTEDAVLPVLYAREGLEFLKERKLNPTYKEYPAGHTISKEMLFDMVNWLNKI